MWILFGCTVTWSKDTQVPGLSNSVCYRACQCIVQTNKQQHSVPINDEWQRQLGVNIPLIKHYLKKKPPCESANYSLFRCIFNTVSAMTLLVCTHCCGLFGVWASESQCWMWQTVTGQTDKPVDAVEVVDDYNKAQLTSEWSRSWFDSWWVF